MTKLHEVAFDEAIAAVSGRGMTKMRAARMLFDAGVAAERERCAKVCESMWPSECYDPEKSCEERTFLECAAAIRKGETP